MSRGRASRQSGNPSGPAAPKPGPVTAPSGVELGALVLHHQDPLAALADLREMRAQTEQLIAVYVARARRAGLTWTQVGYHLGVSAQAVEKRYGKRAQA